nr:hypothetical protein [Tanacetum cinerariifolium]
MHRSTPRAHRTPTLTASPQGKRGKQSVGESSSPRKTHKITIKRKKKEETKAESHKENSKNVNDDDEEIEKKKKDEEIEKETKDEEIEKEKKDDNVEKTDKNTTLNLYPTTSSSTPRKSSANLQHQLYLNMKSKPQDQAADPEIWEILKASDIIKEQISSWKGNLPSYPLFSSIVHLVTSQVCMISALYRAKKEWKLRVLGDEVGLVKQGGDEVFAWGTRVQVEEVVTRWKLKCVCYWADPFKGLKCSNVPGVKLSSFFKSDDTFLSLQALSNLHYLFGGFMDYLCSRELDISNFDPVDRKFLLVDARATGVALGIILIWNSTWRAGGKPGYEALSSFTSTTSDDQSFTVDGDVDDFLVTDNSSMILG